MGDGKWVQLVPGCAMKSTSKPYGGENDLVFPSEAQRASDVCTRVLPTRVPVEVQ